MTDLRNHFREGDPLRHEPGLSADDVEMIRRAMLTELRASSDHRHTVPIALVLAVTIACALAAAVFFGVRYRPVSKDIKQPQAVEQRQLQFETPGGTRIIWVLNPGFEL